MTFKPNRSQLDALAAQVRTAFSSDEMGANAATLIPEIVKCVGRLVTSKPASYNLAKRSTRS